MRRLFSSALLGAIACGGDGAVIRIDSATEAEQPVASAGAMNEGGSGGAEDPPSAAAGGSGGSAGAEAAGGTGAAALPTDVINVEGGDFQSGDAPPSSGVEALPAILSLTGPPAVTNGGSAILHITLASPVDAPKFVVERVGDSGYHTVVVGTPAADGGYDIGVQVAGGASQQALVLRVALTDEAGDVGEYAEISLELVESGLGDVKITLSFDRLHDLDLHVLEPNGEELSYENNASLSGGELDLDSGAMCVPSAVYNENVFWPEGAPSGQYRVTVVNFKQCTPGEIAFSVRVAYDNVVETFPGSFADGTEGAVFEVVTFRR